jgi:hypothetical protein
MLSKFFDSKVRDLLEFYSNTARLHHSGEKGLLRELVVRRLLVSLLPPHFGVGTGIIVDASDRQSRQTDLIIFDRRLLPSILVEESRGIFPMDSVLRTVEVKSRLRKSDIEEAIQAAYWLHPNNPDGLRIASYGKLPGGQTRYPLASLFAFESDWNVSYENLPDSFKNPESNLGAICIADVAFAADRVGERSSPTKEMAVRHFMIMLLDSIENDAATRKPFSVVEWLMR